MQHSITITGLTRSTKFHTNKNGNTVLAYFNAEVNGFSLVGCALVRTAKNGLVVWPPRTEGPEAYRRGVTIIDDSLRHALMQHAREAYRALGGKDAEWIGSSIPMGLHEAAALAAELADR